MSAQVQNGSRGPVVAPVRAQTASSSQPAASSGTGASKTVDSFGGAAGSKEVTAYVNGKPSQITVVPVGNGQYLRADAADAYKRMEAAARKAGINISPGSGFRDMKQQQYLWNGYQAKLRGEKWAQGFNKAARPGFSNHQNGIAMDVEGTHKSYKSAAYQWLAKHAKEYGFVNDVSGEPWHWTFRNKVQ